MPPPILKKNGKIVKKVDFESSKAASGCTECYAKNHCSLQSMISAKIKKNLKNNYHFGRFWSKNVIFGGFSWFVQKPFIVEWYVFLRCVQCIKTLLLSYQNHLYWQFYCFSLKWWGGKIFTRTTKIGPILKTKTVQRNKQ